MALVLTWPFACLRVRKRVFADRSRFQTGDRFLPNLVHDVDDHELLHDGHGPEQQAGRRRRQCHGVPRIARFASDAFAMIVAAVRAVWQRSW